MIVNSVLSAFTSHTKVLEENANQSDELKTSTLLFSWQHHLGLTCIPVQSWQALWCWYQGLALGGAVLYCGLFPRAASKQASPLACVCGGGGGGAGILVSS